MSDPYAAGWSAPYSPQTWEVAPMPPPPWLSPRPAPPAPAAVAPAGNRPVLVALAAGGVLVVAAAAAAAVATSLVLGRADDIGRDMGAALGEELGQAQMDQMEQLFSYGGGYSGGPLTAPPVDQSPPVAPGELGADPVLDQYAQECFAGDHQSCDDLYYESPPFSEYERYASTCGGRVKPFTVVYCTDLD
ncbi:hypothetical protein [Blastococcus sp. SYSU D00820]